MAVVLLLAGLGLLPAGAGGSFPGPSRPSVHAGGIEPGGSGPAQAMLQQAASSLERGDGPSGGVPGRCDATDGGEMTCQGSPGSTGTGTGSVARADPGNASPRWFNVTANISAHSSSGLPSVYSFGRMAYDPLLTELVLFDGCPFAGSGCPDANQTWTYNGISWTNWTRSLPTAPSPRILAGMDYDPAFGGVVLFGGTEYSNSNWVSFNDTWLFNGTSTSPRWTNVTTTVGYPHQPGGGAVSWTWGALAFDPALNELVAVDGCSDLALNGCSSVWEDTWYLNYTTGWSVASGPGGSSTHLFGSSAAYDASDEDLVLFGGYDMGEAAASNLTYLLTPTDAWNNVTSDDAGCVSATCYTPPAREDSAMTWDGQLQAILLTAGLNPGTSTWFNDSWLFSNGTWLPASVTGLPAPAGYDPVAEPAMPETSAPLAPIVIGGSGACSSGCATNEWVYEVPPEPTLTVTPSIADAQMPIGFNSTLTPGTSSGIAGNWNVSFGDGFSSVPGRARGVNTSVPLSYDVNHSYASPGTFQPTTSWVDFYYIVGAYSPPSVFLNPVIETTIDASAETIIVGSTVTFSTNPTGGTPPYTYSWSFGNGNNSTAEDPPAQLYSTVGFPKITLTVTDSVGKHAYGKSLLTVSVKPGPPVSLAPYVIVAIAAVAVVVIAVAALVTRRKKPIILTKTSEKPNASPSGTASPSSPPRRPRPPPANPRAPPPGAGG
ncbi:MAG: PKD domain-containing protein [Thermoplasmata archaeon]